MTNNPKVSVFLSSYNHARYLPQCIESILAQTYRDFEVVIVDDGSTDGSHELLLAMQRRHPERIRYFWHDGHTNCGISASCNLAIRQSRGEYAAWIGSDDFWYPEKLALQTAVLENDPSLGFVYSHAHFVDANGGRLPGLAGDDITQDPDPLARIIESCHPPAMTLVFRRTCLDAVGLFDESLVYSDWELLVRIMSTWRAGFLAQPLAGYRLHSHNTSKGIETQTDLRRVLAVMLALRQKAASYHGLLAGPRYRALLDLQISYLLYGASDRQGALANLERAFVDDPSLASDAAHFNDWLECWKPDYCGLFEPRFEFWAIAHLPQSVDVAYRQHVAERQLARRDIHDFFVRRAIQKGLQQRVPYDAMQAFQDCPEEVKLPIAWKAGIVREAYAALLFESHRRREPASVRYYWRKAVRSSSSWLGNRGVWMIGLQAVLGLPAAASASRDSAKE